MEITPQSENATRSDDKIGINSELPRHSDQKMDNVDEAETIDIVSETELHNLRIR